ncbi:MAG: hypothetical protein ABJA98_11800 [Acidobacteriota bacterium]
MRLGTVLGVGSAGRAAIATRGIGRALAGLLMVSGLVASAHTQIRRTANVKSGCVDRFDPETDYFPDKAVIEDAANFRIEYRKSYKLVTVTQASAGGPTERATSRIGISAGCLTASGSAR